MFKSTEVCEVLQVVLECVGNLVEREVALNYNGVDGRAVCHEGLHNAVDMTLGLHAFDSI